MDTFEEIKDSVYKYNRETGAIGTDSRGEFSKPLMCKKLSDEEIDVVLEHLSESEPTEVRDAIEFLLDEINHDTIVSPKLKGELSTTYMDVVMDLQINK